MTVLQYLQSNVGICVRVNPLSANSTKWSNTLKQFVGRLPTNCLSVFDHFVELAFKGLMIESQSVEKFRSLWVINIANAFSRKP